MSSIKLQLLTRPNQLLPHERAQRARVVVLHRRYAECDRDVLDGLDVVFGSDQDGEGLAGDDGGWGVEACYAGGRGWDGEEGG